MARRTNTFGITTLHRAAHRRELAATTTPQNPRYLLVWQEKNLIAPATSQPAAVHLTQQQVKPFLERGAELVFLCEQQGQDYIALDISFLEKPDAVTTLPDEASFEDLRASAAAMADTDAAMLAYARAMVYWHQRHQYCGVCGHQTESSASGHVRKCSHPGCATTHFPRTDPAIIVLVHTDDRCLLGRQSAWPEGLYSTLAGFVEPGESLEAAVEREIFEEAGITLRSAKYHSSQPWPFPASLMVGFTAEADSTEITLDDSELEDVRWFTREQVSSELKLPGEISIARRLIEEWLEPN